MVDASPRAVAAALRQLTRDIDALSFRLRLLLGLIALAFLVVIPLEVWFRV